MGHDSLAATLRAPHVTATPPAANLLRPIRFSTADFPCREQFAAWQAYSGTIVDLSLPRGCDEAGYVASHAAWKLGALALSHMTGPGLRFRRSAAQIRRDSLDHWVVSFPRRGSVVLRSRLAEIAAPARTLHVFALHEPFEGTHDDIEWLTLFVSRDLLPELAPSIDAALHRPLGSAVGTLLGHYLDALARELPSMTESELPRVAEATRAMLAACLAPAGEACEIAREQIERTRLSRIKAIIRQNLRSPTLGPRRLCSLGGVSRSQLYRLFEPIGGVARYIQSERLRHAHRALSEPSDMRDVLHIAEDAGFYDASTFSRAFRREFGITPTALRRAAQAGQRGAPIRLDGAREPRFAEILQLL